MSIIYIPTGDFNTSAALAPSITTKDFGVVPVGEGRRFSVRIGNRSNQTLAYTLTLRDQADIYLLSPRHYQVVPDSGSLEPDQISDTIGIDIVLSLNEQDIPHTVDLICQTSDGETATFAFTFMSVGANTTRRAEYPDRATELTDLVDRVVIRDSEPLELHSFNPIGLVPPDYTGLIKLIPQKKGFLIAGDLYTRLDPTNKTYGYTETKTTILGSFQSEEDEVRTDFTADDPSQTYRGSASVTVPASFGSLLSQSWALFAPASDLEPAQFKKTVHLFKRQGEIWAIIHVHSRWRGAELSHYECQCFKIHQRDMGSTDYFNPFAWVFREHSDKPYRMYLVDYPDDLLADEADTENPYLENPYL